VFLLDANVLICCFHDYYPIDRVPEYWEWLAFQGEVGVVKIPAAIWDEALIRFFPATNPVNRWA